MIKSMEAILIANKNNVEPKRVMTREQKRRVVNGMNSSENATNTLVYMVPTFKELWDKMLRGDVKVNTNKKTFKD